MKKLEIAIIYTAIFLSVVGENLSFGSHLRIQRAVRERSALFQKVKEDEVLEGHVIAKFLVPSELDCLHRCVLSDNCVSFNYQRLSFKSTRRTCELNDVTLLSSGETLVRRNGYSYKEPIDLSYDGDKHRTTSKENRQLELTSSAEEMSSISSMTSSSVIVMSKSSLSTLSKTSSPVASMIVSSNALATSSMISSPLSCMITPSKTTSFVTPSISSSNVLAKSSMISSALTSLPSSHQSVTQTTFGITMTSSASLLNSTSGVTTSSITLLSSSSQPQADCTGGWYGYRTGCIRFFTQPKTRADANSHCKSFMTSNNEKGGLIKIPSVEDNDQVVSLAPRNGKYYIGLTDTNQEGVYRWKWTTDDATYFNWESGYPQATNIEKDRDCVVISTHPDNSYKKWSTVHCTNSWMYICECKSACS
nr:uncharacterized protein LOC131768677 [Pocillopora verrucosa]